MFWTKTKVSMRKVMLPVAVLGLTAAGMIICSQLNSVSASNAFTASNSIAASPAATFPGTGVGAIPDASAGGPGAFGTPLNITFNVSGLTAPLSDVKVDFTATHSWIGDLNVVLTSPGGTASQVIFSQVGATSATSFGSSSDLLGTYSFFDAAAGTNIWTASAATPVPAGNYRTTAAGPSASTPPFTSLTSPFAGLTTAQVNGTWTLAFRDGAAGDTGSVTAANLTLTGGAAAANDAPVDFNGDGKSDYAIVRNTGGGANGQITWSIALNGGSTIGAAWGLASDFFVPEDYDGDLKDDIAVWRPGAATQAFWYILQSNGNTLRTESFGQAGDDPSVIGDYNGDGKADLAVYRAGASAGLGSTWFFRTTPEGPVNYMPWGQNGDFPAPGDYDGDGKNDFVVQRNNGGGQARFWLSQTTAGFATVVFGTPTDVVVPGDYDGDGKTDIATIRGSAGAINWYIRPSSTGVISGSPTAIFGASATDFPTQGDYDGDGKTDIAIWRPNADATMCNFWSLNSSNGAARVFEWGQNGDYPVANYNAH